MRVRPVVIVGYDPAWPAAYEVERGRIAAALGEAMAGVVAIEHVGSTSVPGLAAKPVIDIMVGVRRLAGGLRCITPMVELGYECVGEHGVPGRIYFRRGAPRTHHVHLVEHSGEFWRRHLAFRDALLASPALVERYAALKRDLASRHRDDSDGYTDAKTPFIEAALAQAGG